MGHEKVDEKGTGQKAGEKNDLSLYYESFVHVPVIERETGKGGLKEIEGCIITDVITFRYPVQFQFSIYTLSIIPYTSKKKEGRGRGLERAEIKRIMKLY